MKHLYFVRHGESVMNKRGIFSGRTETPLTEDGKSQALSAGNELKKISISCIVCSPMGRAKQTAELIADSIGYPRNKIITNELFTERDFGPLEKTTFQPDLGDSEGVESVDELMSRADKGLDFMQSLPGDTILLVSHGAIGRALRHCVDPNIPFRPSDGFENGKVVQLV
jgi:broad specificity phosphatase PhoE